MAVEHSPAVKEKDAGALVATAEDALSSRKKAPPNEFVRALLAGAVPEDLLRYEARELAELCEAAWTFLAERKPERPKIRIANPDSVAGGDQLKQISVLEIVNDDMPFLLDSVLGELSERGVEIRLVLHPIISVARDATGRLSSFQASPAAGSLRESFIHIHIERIEEEARRSELMGAIEQVLADVRICVHDWRPMMDRIQETVVALKTNPPPLPPDEIAEAIQFMDWLITNNFTFLGVRNYVFTAGEGALEPQYETGLGLLRDRDLQVLRRGDQMVAITPEIREFLKEPKLLIVTKSAVRSRVHRRAYMDYIGIKQFDSAGKLAGELRIVGLFTSTAYTQTSSSIPYLRRKIASVVDRAGFVPEGHSGKALINVLETFPRDELFQIDEDLLYQFALAILQLDERPRVRVLSRRDRFDRFVSVLVYVPRDRYHSGVRQAIGDYLAKVYQGHVSAFYPFFPEGPLVRVHFIIGRREGATPNPDRATLEDAVSAISRTWTDTLVQALAEAFEPQRAQALAARYREAFSQGFRESYSPRVAVHDIKVIEKLTEAHPLSVDFDCRDEEGGNSIGLKVWSLARPIALSERVPVLENMGFRVVDEQTYQISAGAAEEPDVWLHDMTIERANGAAFDLDAVEQQLEGTFLIVIRGGAENDGFNALVMAAGLMWRDVVLLRTIARFLRQIRVPYSQGYMSETLVKHQQISAQIVQLFQLRFDPRLDVPPERRAADEAKLMAAIEAELQAVESLDEDRILRHFVNAVQAAVRTNFYQLGSDGMPKPQFAIKSASRKVDGLPLPRPLYEIFVYSPQVEGVHLRFGKVARGGIRWSDRPQDFRTEVLGLVKAQQVKNAVIVPVGAKGGFVPKFLPTGPREAVQAEGTAAYTLFVSSMLDITDNLGPDGVIHPENVARHDNDDPYLVVAADKGTATFSDTANGISAQYGFWLGDAFASGGSAGYDHKKMGITARGAWEAVRRHFREIDVDIATT